MPAYLVLHEGNAFSFYGLCDDGGRHALYGCFCLIKCSFQLIKIIAIATLITWKLNAFEFLVDRIW